MTVNVRPTIRRIAIVALVVLLPIAAHSLWDYLEVQRLVREIERIQAKREPVTEQQATGRRHVSPENLGAAAYYAAAGMLALGTNPYTVNTPIREWLAGATATQPVPQPLVTALQDLLAASGDALALADKAALLPFSGFVAGTEYSYRTASMGSVAELVSARSLGLSIAGQGDAALDSVIAGLQARRALEESRGWFAGRADVAAVLSFADPSPAALERVQTAFEQADNPEQALAHFLRERARYLEMIWHRFYGHSPDAPRQYRLPVRGVVETIVRPWRSHKLVETLQLWARLVEVARQPWPQRAEAGARVIASAEQELDPRYSRFYFPLMGRDLPLGVFARAIDATPLIIDRCSIAAVAVERFKHDTGTLPATLSDLAPQYLASVPIDPLSGRPLLFRSSADGYTIYSVGQNGRDDGGNLTAPAPAERRRLGRRANSPDIGIRVVTASATRGPTLSTAESQK